MVGQDIDDESVRGRSGRGQAQAGVVPGASELTTGVRDTTSDRERLLDELRPVAFAIAYRMLGSVAEAEDVVQDALLRVHQALQVGEQLASPHAFVATVTTRLAINQLRSARARREHYVGEWLPEPIVTDGRDDPARRAEMADSLSLAILALLERLSPEQRAVLLLHDVFDYEHAQIAQIIGKSEDNVRQLARRARRHVAQRRPRFRTTREQREELAGRFFRAAEQGDLAGLEALLADDVQLAVDGGGKTPALAQTLRGRSRVARTLTRWFRLVGGLSGVSLRPAEVNGGPGALLLDPQQRLIAVVALDTAGGQIASISSVVNPDKLAHLGPVGDFTSLLRSARWAPAIDPREKPMSTVQDTSNKAVLRRFCDAANTGDTELLFRTIDELVEPGAQMRTLMPTDATGAELLKEVFATLLRAYPDLHVAIEDLIEEGDKVVMRNVVTGTHRGEHMGIPPTGRSIRYDEIFIARFADGRIAETWGVVDVLSQMRQLGVIPAQPTSSPGAKP